MQVHLNIDDRIVSFLKRAFTRRKLMIAFAAVSAASAAVYAASVPNTFSAGQVVSATAMNANFNALTTAVTTLEGKSWSGSTSSNLYFTGGNVGIGTTTPAAKLTVAGDSKVDGIAYFDAEATSSNYSFANTKVLAVKNAVQTLPYSTTDQIGVVGLGSAYMGESKHGVGVLGIGAPNGGYHGTGVKGIAKIPASTSNGVAYGGFFASTDAHNYGPAGGDNVAVYAEASGASAGGKNYSVYGSAGTLYNAGNVGIAQKFPNNILALALNQNQGIDFGDQYQPSLRTHKILATFSSVDDKNNALLFYTDNTVGGQAAERMRINAGGYVGIGTTSPSEKLHVVGNITATGTITPGSSRALKERIRDLKLDDAQAALGFLKPTRFYYKTDKTDEHLGFIAEDVPALLATKDRKGVDPMDVAAVLTKVVQQQQHELDNQRKAFTAQIEELKKQVKQLMRRGG